MKLITVHKSTRALLAAVAENKGGFLGSSGVHRIEGELVTFEVEDDTAEKLQALDPDPDKAIRILMSTGVGHS